MEGDDDLCGLLKRELVEELGQDLVEVGVLGVLDPNELSFGPDFLSLLNHCQCFLY